MIEGGSWTAKVRPGRPLWGFFRRATVFFGRRRRWVSDGGGVLVSDHLADDGWVVLQGQRAGMETWMFSLRLLLGRHSLIWRK